MNKLISPLAFLFVLTGSAFGQQQSEYLYTTANVTNGFRVNLESGALTPIPGATLAIPGFGVMDPASHFLFITTTSGIIVAKIDPPTGELTIVPGSPFAPSLSSLSIAVSPNGRFVYAAVAALSGNPIYKFTVDGNVGAITQTGPPVLLASEVGSLSFSPNGKFLYAGANPIFSSDPLYCFSVNPSTGDLTPLSSQAMGSYPVITPNGSYLYSITETIFGNTEINAYAIDPASGVLTPVPGSPFSAGASYPLGISLDRTGSFLYQPTQNIPSGVAGYVLNTANGALAGSVPGSPFATGDTELSFIVDRSNRFAFNSELVSSYTQSLITEFSLDATTGSLTALPTALNISGPFPSITFAVPKPASTATLTALTLLPANPTITSPTTTKQFIAEGNYSDGTLRFLTASVTWSSSVPSVATISKTPGQQGLATIIGNGQTTVTATLDGLTATSTLTVAQ